MFVHLYQGHATWNPDLQQPVLVLTLLETNLCSMMIVYWGLHLKIKLCNSFMQVNLKIARMVSSLQLDTWLITVSATLVCGQGNLLGTEPGSSMLVLANMRWFNMRKTLSSSSMSSCMRMEHCFYQDPLCVLGLLSLSSEYSFLFIIVCYKMKTFQCFWFEDYETQTVFLFWCYVVLSV